MSYIRSLMLVATLLIYSEVADAALVISMVPSAGNYTQGDTGFVDVLVHSDSNDQLDSFLFNLDIVGGSGVTFIDPQSETFLTDGNYVFQGRSGNIGFGFGATSVTNAGATLTMADISYDFASPPNPLPRTIPDATNPLLLGRFDFLTSGPGNFSISLDPTASFSDSAFNTFVYTATGTNFTVTAVPEPSSLALVCSMGALAAWARKRRVA